VSTGLSEGLGAATAPGYDMGVPVPATDPVSMGPVRALRAGALAVPALALALAAHLLAGGRTPPGPALLGAGVAIGCVATVATGRRLGPGPIWAGLAGSQGLLHLWLGATSRGGCGRLRPDGWSANHLHGMSVVDCLGAAAPAGSTVPPGAPVAGGPFIGHAMAMLGAHLLAVLLTGWLLGHGEALLWRLWDRLVAPFRLPRPARPPTSARSPQGWFPARPAPPPSRLILPARRGPPVAHAPG
jgi:hypothetical protein